MDGDVFIDTNVLVYSRDTAEPEKHRKARAWMTQLWTTRRGRLSYEVLQEPVTIDARVLAAAGEVQDRYRLTDDLQDGQMLGTVQVVDPFRLSPERLTGR